MIFLRITEEITWGQEVAQGSRLQDKSFLFKFHFWDFKYFRLIRTAPAWAREGPSRFWCLQSLVPLDLLLEPQTIRCRESLSCLTRQISSYGSRHGSMTAKWLEATPLRPQGITHTPSVAPFSGVKFYISSPLFYTPRFYPHHTCDIFLRTFSVYLCVFVHVIQAAQDSLCHLGNPYWSF